MKNNNGIYNAVLAGITGAGQQRWITSQAASSYIAYTVKVIAIADAIDALIPTDSGIGIAQARLMQSICEGIYADRDPSGTGTADIARAIVALYTAQAANLTPELGGGTLISFNGRTTPAVVPTAGDYAAGLVTNDSIVPGASVKNALETLYGDIVEVPPIDLALHSVSDQIIFNVQPDALVYLNEDFSNSSLARFTIVTEGTLGTPSIAGGNFIITGTSPGDKNTGVLEGADIGMPQCAVTINVVSRVGNAGNTYENVGVGIAKDSNNFILALWRRVDNLASIQVKIAGVANFQASVSSAGWVLPFEIGLSLVANSLTFWRRVSGGVWTKITSYDVAGTFNFKTQNLTGWKSCFWVATQSAQTVTFNFSTFKAGRFGSCSIRDLVVVSNEDGSPRFSGNTVTLSATCCDPQAAAYCAVFTLDLITRVLTQVGVIMISRGGAIQNDNAAHIIAYDDGTFQFFMTTWGDAGGAAALIQILYKNVTTQNLLSGALVVVGMAQLNLPLPALAGCYDPYAVKIGSIWYLAYTVGPAVPFTYYPALVTSPNLTIWTLVGSDSTAFPYEGTRIVSLGGAYWVLCANLAGSNVYDLNMVLQGKCDTLVVVGTYPAHPMLVPLGNYVYQITFDDTVFPGAAANTIGHFRQLRARRYGVNKS